MERSSTPRRQTTVLVSAGARLFVIKGWDEGVVLMHVGVKLKLVFFPYPAGGEREQ